MKLFLAHKIDRYGLSESIYGGVSECKEFRTYRIEDLRDYPFEIVTYELDHLLNQIREIHNGSLPFLTDLSQIIKINSGRSKRTYKRGNYPWNFWNRINRDIGEEESKRLFSTIRESNDHEELIKCIEYLANKVKEYYEESIAILDETNQLSRFIDIENRVQQLLNKRQIEGIHINSDKLLEIVNNLELSKNGLLNRLRYKYNILDLNYKYLRLYLIGEGFKISAKDYDYFNLISFLKNAKITSEICKDIYIALRVKYDYEKLKQYITENGNLIYPQFDCIGTITSRILINYPHIQQLKRENRIIFNPKDGFVLLYCDFSQFEPGILASFCKDKIMIELYNSGDIYASFSEYIFGTKTLRKEAKVLFLSYLYGMSNKKLINSIDGIIKSKGLTQNTSATEYFSKFKDLNKFRKLESEKAINLGFIQSDTTLRRYIKKTKNGLKGKKSEARFVLSQLIQGTASYILKTAMLEVSKDEEIEFLIPMHDAVLYQVPLDMVEEKRSFIERCFLNQYKSICSDIDPKVDFKAFEE